MDPSSNWQPTPIGMPQSEAVPNQHAIWQQPNQSYQSAQPGPVYAQPPSFQPGYDGTVSPQQATPQNAAYYSSQPVPQAQYQPPEAQMQPQSQPLADQPQQAQSSAAPNDNQANEVETAWIERAKQIALQNESDPHEQSRQLGMLKAQYIKARYNRDVRVLGE